MSFSPDISSVSILRAFRLFKPLRNLQVFPSMRLLMRTLIASANRLRFLVILYFFVIMMFAIIGVNLMQGVTTFRCRQTAFPNNEDWLPVKGDTRSCGWAHSCDLTCGSLYQNQFMINGSLVTLPIGNVTNLDRDSEIKELFFSYATFDNLFRGFLTLFQISTLQNWYKIMYMLQDSYNSYISGIFFVIYLLMTNYFVHILIIGIIMQRFIEFNEHKERQQIYQKILGMDGDGESINIEELKNMFREDDQITQEIKKQKRRTIKEQVAQLIFDIMSHKGEPLPKGRYFKHAAPMFCWNLNQNIIYELGLALAGLINALALAFLRYPENEANQVSVDVINISVTTIFAIDMLVRLIGQGFYGFITNLENILYTFSTIGGAVHIIYTGGAASPISAFMALKVYKIVMRSGYYQTFNQLIDSIIFTLAVVMSYCAIMILFIYIFSLLGMQFFAGRLKFAADGAYDPTNGKVPRQNFDTILWSATTVLQIVIGDDWSLVMFNCMLSTGWYSCFYFVALILFGYIILMNLFQAILIGNFEEASLIMRDTKFLKTLQKVAEDPMLEPGNNKVDSEQAELFMAKQRKRNTIFMPKIYALALAPNDVEIESKPIPNPSPITIKPRPQNIAPVLPPLITIDQFAGGSKKRQDEGLLSPNNNNRGSGLATPIESDRLPLAHLSSGSRPQSAQSSNSRRGSLQSPNQFLLSPSQKRSAFKNNVVSKAEIQSSGSGSGSGDIIDVKFSDLQQKATRTTGILKSKIKIPALPVMVEDNQQIDEQNQEESARSNFSFDEENPGQERGSNTRKKLDLLAIQKMNTKNQSIRKQNAKIGAANGNLILKKVLSQTASVDLIEAHPIRNYMKNSSCCLFHRKSRIRKNIFKIVIDPDYDYPENETKKVNFEDLDNLTQEDLLNQGFIKGQHILQRSSTFFSYRLEATDASHLQSQQLKNQKSVVVKVFTYHHALHNLLNYIISCVIFMNIILLLIEAPTNEAQGTSIQSVKILDNVCTIIFIFEAFLKIISLGFVSTTLENQKAYIFQLWNFADFFIIIMSLTDIIYDQPRHDGMLNAFKSFKSFHLLTLMKKNDLMEIIINTMFRSIKPIMVALTLTLSFIFVYSLVGVNFFRGQFFYCKQEWEDKRISLHQVVSKFDCNNLGGEWSKYARNFDNIFNAMLSMFEMMSSEDWLSTMYRGLDTTGIETQPMINNRQIMLLYFLPFMIVGHIFIWRIFGGVIIENFNRARDKFYDYALMTSEQRNWVEMQRFLIDKRLKVKIDDQQWIVQIWCKNIVQSNKFDVFILLCIVINTTLQAISYYGNPEVLDTIQNIASYIFAGIFNMEAILKLFAYGKYYFWESHNIFDFALIIGTNLGILLTAAFPNFQIGPLAALLRAFRIGRVLRLLKEKKSLKMLIDTIFYIFPILANIVVYMFIIILIYTIIGMYLFAKVMHQVEVNDNANFETLGGGLLLLFRCTTGEKWNLLMREYTYEGAFKGKMCLMEQSYENYLMNGPQMCGTPIGYVFFLSYVIIMQMMVVNLFTAIVLEGFAQFSIQNNSVVSTEDYDALIELWSHYDPTATGWIKPKHLAFLIYELPAPLGKAEDYKEILKKTLDHNTMIKQYSDKKAINMKTKFIYNEDKGLILPHNTVMKLLIELSLPVYSFEGNSVVHFKDVCLTVTKKAIQKSIDQKQTTQEEFSIENKNIEQLFDKIPEQQQRKLDEVWKKKYKNLQKAQLIEDYDTGKLWAGLYILQMIRSVNNGFGRSQFKKKLAQNRLFKKLQKKNAGIQRQGQIQANPAQEGGESKNKSNNPMTKALGNAIQQKVDVINKDFTSALIGGPQKRGRSPMMKDQARSTWWMQGEKREHFVKWMQNNNIQPSIRNSNSNTINGGNLESQTNDSEGK